MAKKDARDTVFRAYFNWLCGAFTILVLVEHNLEDSLTEHTHVNPCTHTHTISLFYTQHRHCNSVTTTLLEKDLHITELSKRCKMKGKQWLKAW